MLRKQICSLPEWGSYNISKNTFPNFYNTKKGSLFHEVKDKYCLWRISRTSRALFIIIILPHSFNKYWIEKEQWKEEIGGTLAYLNVSNSCGEDSMYSAVVAYQILSSVKQSKHLWFYRESEVLTLIQQNIIQSGTTMCAWQQSNKNFCQRHNKNSGSRWRQNALGKDIA